MNKSLNSKNKYNSPMKHFPKDLSTKRLFSKPKRHNTCSNLETRLKEDTNFKKISTKTSLFNPNIKKIIKSGVKSKKSEKSNNNLNNLSFEETILEKKFTKKALRIIPIIIKIKSFIVRFLVRKKKFFIKILTRINMRMK